MMGTDLVVLKIVLLAKYTFSCTGETCFLVEGHQILDALVANEAVDGYRRSTREGSI